MSINKVAKNTAWIIGCRIAQSVLALIINMITARYLGPSNFGVINYAASIVAFVVPIMQLGITRIIVNELVKDPEREGELLGTSLILTFISSLFCVFGVISFASVANAGEKETVVVCALYSIMLIFQSTEMLQYWFQAKLKSKYMSIAVLIAYVLVSIYKVYLLVTGKSVYWFALSNAIDYLLISIILFLFYKKQGGQKLKFSFDLAKMLLKSGRYYIVSSMMVMIFAQTDKIMLKFMVDNDAVGYYSAATSIAGITSFVFTALITSFQPVIFENFKNNHEKFEKGMSQLYSVIFYLSLAQSVVMTIGASIFVNILYGSDYDSAASALQIVVWYTTFSYFGSVRNVWIVANSKQKYLWIINLVGAIGNVILNYVLIPFWGINGAAIASLITQILTNVIMGFIIKPILPNNILMIKGFNPCLLAGLFKKLIK